MLPVALAGELLAPVLAQDSQVVVELVPGFADLQGKVALPAVPLVQVPGQVAVAAAVQVSVRLLQQKAVVVLHCYEKQVVTLDHNVVLLLVAV